MKILFLFQGLPHYYNAILNRLHALENTWVTVVVPSTLGMTLGKGVFQSEEGINFEVIRLREYETYYGKPFFRGMREVLDRVRPDVVIASWPYIQGFFLLPAIVLYIQVHRIKLVEKTIPYLIPKMNDAWSFYSQGKNISEENSSPARKPPLLEMMRYVLLTIFRRYYLPKLDAHVCYVEEAFGILGSYHVPREKIHIIYNSPDTDEILSIREKVIGLPRILPENRFRIIHIGRLVRWKKVHMLIAAVHRLSARFGEAELIVIGNGPEEENLKRQAAELGIGDKVKFLGGIYDQTTIGRYLHESSIYVLAGVGGLSINEAMCYGRPVICSECDGTEKKLVREEFNGKYFRNDDETDLAEKIRYLFERPDLTERMGINSLTIINNEVNVNTVINGYKQSFEYLMSKRKNNHGHHEHRFTI